MANLVERVVKIVNYLHKELPNWDINVKEGREELTFFLTDGRLSISRSFIYRHIHDIIDVIFLADTIIDDVYNTQQNYKVEDK